MNATRLVTALALASTVVLTAAPVLAAGADTPVSVAAVQQVVAPIAPQVTVTVRDHGVVELSGWAQDRDDVLRAAAAARRVPGVKQAYSQNVRVWSTRTM